MFCHISLFIIFCLFAAERGNNYLLSSKIGDEMPLLNVDITGGKGSALQGEIMQWRIEIKNLGTAPASNVILKASLPWVCQEGPPGTASEATSGFIGLSGTVMSLPIEKDILPNEAISVPVKVKANGGGRQNIRLLFRYNLATPNSASATHNDEQKYIYLRKTVSVAVYPSMNLTASIMPSFTRSKEHILSVEVSFIILTLAVYWLVIILVFSCCLQMHPQMDS